MSDESRCACGHDAEYHCENRCLYIVSGRVCSCKISQETVTLKAEIERLKMQIDELVAMLQSTTMFVSWVDNDKLLSINALISRVKQEGPK